MSTNENAVDEVILDEIVSLVQDTDFDNKLVSCVLLRLSSLGYTVLENDVFLVSFSIDKVDKAIKQKCNVNELPEGLYNVAIDRVCGEVLYSLQATQRLGSNFDVDTALESIKMGDTTISFSDNTKNPAQRIDLLINSLKSCGEGEFSCYRKIKWF